MRFVAQHIGSRMRKWYLPSKCVVRQNTFRCMIQRSHTRANVLCDDTWAKYVLSHNTLALAILTSHASFSCETKHVKPRNSCESSLTQNSFPRDSVSVLQRVAACCSVLQCAAVCFSVLQRVAACCSVLQIIEMFITKPGHTRF